MSTARASEPIAAQHARVRMLHGDPVEHPAIEAWRALGHRAVDPQGVETLKQRNRASTYRLLGMGPRGGSLIAKRCRRSTGMLERTIYQEILPILPVSSLRFHGLVEEGDGEFCWLFLEDAGTEECCGLTEKHGLVVAHWLGAMHAAAADLALEIDLPERGPAYYLEHLRSAHDAMLQSLAEPDLPAQDVAILEEVVTQCRLLADCWHRLERLCDGMPRTLVHGDFVAKNIRVRREPEGLALLTFDWEVAGWGIAAADLVQFGFGWLRSGLSVFASTVRRRWPNLTVNDIDCMADVGRIFWLLTVLSAESEGLSCRAGRKPVEKLGVYRSWMAQALRAIAREL